MAGTIVQGAVSTAEVLGGSDPDAAGERVLDMADRIRVLDPDDAQFTTMTDRASTRTAVREKVNWLEEEDFPRVVTGDAQTNVATALNLGAGQGKIVQANDILRNMRTNEAMRIVSVTTDALVIARAISTTPGTGVATNAGDSYLVVSDAQPQGSDFPVARYLARVLGYNYTQITRTPWTFTGTQTAIELYGGREPAKEAKRKAREHKRKWEAIGFFGARSFIASSALPAGNLEPQGTAGGAVEFITTNTLDCLGAKIDPKKFDLFASNVFAHGNPDAKVFFCSPVIAMGMSDWNRSGMGGAWKPERTEVYGVHVTGFISGAYGYNLPVVVKKEWSSFPVAGAGYGGYGFLLDMDYVQQIPMRDRDTKLLTEQQPKGRDTYAAEYFREATWEFSQERCHGRVFGAIQP